MSTTVRDRLKRPIIRGRTPQERQAEWAEFAKLLAIVKAKRLYLLDGYPTWAAYIPGRWGRSRRWADKLIQDHGLSTAPTRLEYGEGLQVGRELARVQRRRSYRNTHGSFRVYVWDKYNRPVGWAYRRIAEYNHRVRRL